MSQYETDTSLEQDKPLAVLPPKDTTRDDAIEFLLDRELRRELASGKKWRARKIVDLIHAAGWKTAAEKEEEAEADRVAKLTAARAEEANSETGE